MKITINEQILTGNCGEATSRDISAYIDELREEFVSTAKTYFPDAEVVVEIDTQSASGCSRETTVWFEDENGETIFDYNMTRPCEDSICACRNIVWERGNFWEVSEE